MPRICVSRERERGGGGGKRRLRGGRRLGDKHGDNEESGRVRCSFPYRAWQASHNLPLLSVRGASAWAPRSHPIARPPRRQIMEFALAKRLITGCARVFRRITHTREPRNTSYDSRFLHGAFLHRCKSSGKSRASRILAAL
jgi:hypothetical protein